MRTYTFQQFWDAYGLKRDRYAAERVWRRLKASDQRAAYNGIASYRKDCERRGISMMYGQGYLSHRRWEDDPDAPNNTNHKLVNNTNKLADNDCSQLPEIETW